MSTGFDIWKHPHYMVRLGPDELEGAVSKIVEAREKAGHPIDRTVATKALTMSLSVLLREIIEDPVDCVLGDGLHRRYEEGEITGIGFEGWANYYAKKASEESQS